MNGAVTVPIPVVGEKVCDTRTRCPAHCRIAGIQAGEVVIPEVRRSVPVEEPNRLERDARLQRMIPQCLGYVVEYLIDVLRLIGCALRTPVADAIDYAQRQTTLVRREWNTAEAQGRSQIGIGVRLKEGESASIKAEAELIGQSWTEDMRLHADNVLR